MSKTAYQYLSDHDIRPSVQRVAIMDYLMENRTHPTADRIYTDLADSVPTLSRMTVYNTLSLLAAKGAILKLDLECGTTHWDGDTTPHAHFVCIDCGAIHDIFTEPEDWQRIQAAVPAPKGTSVSDTQFSYKGLCAKCNETNNTIHN